MPLSTYTKEKITEHILGRTAWDRGVYPQNTYFSLHVSPGPGDTGINEANYAGYQRVLANWNNATTSGATNMGVHTFAAVSVSSITVTHIGLWDAQSGGNFLFSIPVNSTQFDSGAAPKILDQGVTITPGPSYHNNVIASITNHMTGKVEYNFDNSIFVALFNTTPTQSTNGTEATGGSYARQQVAFDEWGADVIDNTSDEDFLDATDGTIGTINGIAVMSASTGGNRILFGNVTSPATINNGDSYKIPAGDLDITT